MIKEFLMKKMLEAKLKEVPKEEQDKMMAIVSKNPELFMKIAREIEENIKTTGKGQVDAAMEVMKNHQEEIKKLMQ